MIQIKQLSKIYSKGKNQVSALEDINLTIEQGTIYGIIGLSGAGKSSLIRCINRIEEPTSGEVWINNVDITHLSPGELRKVRKKIGMIFQNFNLLSSKTVFDNIAFPLRLNKTPENVVKEKVMALLKLVDLTEKAHVYPSQLSGGQKQRVGIARALVSDPDVLLCDEATSALDPKTTKQILSLLKEINQGLGLTIVIITHEMEVIKEVCTDVTILEHGRVVEQGKTIDIFSKPGNEITKHFVDQIQHLPTHLHNGTLLSLSFTQGSAGEPVISKLIKDLQVDVNILAGKIEWIQEKPIGKLTVEVDRNTVPLAQIIDYFEKNHVRVEVFNYA
ncbi:MAG: methionine transporter ATP-binding protein [Anaerosolibacter sp.]|jgi:D-methionine transport system ATP-binding protein|uniref:methionine ABC transporter ATP-binding protein n=1 Tax=Anaerosolibacter sp. TaxID=1872527 RepID=UPI002607C1C4|nr:ATP-binding cassette domain-containing protein [Anaerosolibacter sp.]MDF2546710.1 methionine transporter ATP-binding protein [Anaerosolibacter sp.]